MTEDFDPNAESPLVPSMRQREQGVRSPRTKEDIYEVQSVPLVRRVFSLRRKRISDITIEISDEVATAKPELEG